MNKIIAVLILSAIFTTNTFAQIAALKVIIIDAENNNPVENATVFIKERNKSVITDAYGVFSLNKIAIGYYNLSISHIGYATEQAIISVVNNNNSVKIKLQRSKISLDNITVQANKQNNYSKIAAIDLLLRPINNAQDVLRSIPGLFIAQHAGGGKAEQIFLRGFDIDHGTDINITVDGMPVNMISHAHGQGYADLHFLIPETIDKVNFDKGPYNAEKGNLATAGFVDFKTKDFLTNNSIKVEAGKFDMQRISSQIKIFSKTNKNKTEQLYVTSEYFKSNGYFESPQNFNRFNIMGKYSLVKNNNTKLNILLSTFNSKWNASGQIPERAVEDGSISKFGFIDDMEGGNTSRTNASISFSKKLNKNIEIAQQAYYTNYNFNLFSNFTFYLNDPIDGDMINQKEKRNIYGYWAKAKIQNSILNKKATLSFGAGFRYDNVGEINLAAAPKRVFKNNIQYGSVKENNVYAFVSQFVEINNKLNFNASVRYDNFKFGYKNFLQNETNFTYQNKDVVSPKLNFNYNLSNKISMFINNGIGFHSNDTRVILKDSIKNILPKVYGTDIGITVKPTKNLYTKLILWHLLSEQEFVYVGDAGVVEPSGASRRIGIDLITRYQINKWLYADVDISLAKARYIEEKKGENHIPLAPLFTSIGGLTAKVDTKFSASLRYRFMGLRPASEDYTVQAKGYFLIDAVANYKYKKLDFNLSVENILNQKWKEAQFNTESRLFNEANPVSEIHYTPGSPFFIKAGIGISF